MEEGNILSFSFAYAFHCVILRGQKNNSCCPKLTGKLQTREQTDLHHNFLELLCKVGKDEEGFSCTLWDFFVCWSHYLNIPVFIACFFSNIRMRFQMQ